MVFGACLGRAEAKVSSLIPGRPHPVFEARPGAVLTTSAGVEIDLSTLTPVDVTAPGFTAVVDGEDVTAKVRGDTVSAGVAVGPQGEPMRVTASVGEDGSARFVEMRGPDGKRGKDLMRKKGGGTWELEEIGNEDYDEEVLSQFGCAELGLDGTVLEGHDHNHDDLPGSRSRGGRVKSRGREDWVIPSGSASSGRALQSTTCAELRVIDVAVAFTAEFCADEFAEAGGSGTPTPDAAIAAVQTIVGLASVDYEVSGLCTRLRLSAVEGSCNPDTDPFSASAVISAGYDAGEACGGQTGGRLDYLKNGVNAGTLFPAGRGADAVHLFTGTYGTSSTIGCAYVGALCSSYKYGVEMMTYTDTPRLQVSLFAHELGHNSAANHVQTSTVYLMYPQNYGGSAGFAQVSRDTMSSHIGSRSCITTIGVGCASDAECIATGPCEEAVCLNAQCVTRAVTPCCGNGVCEADGGETCDLCAVDCAASARCGNGVCEGGDGENCQTCPADCAGRTSGKPSRRYCCGADNEFGGGCFGACGSSCTLDSVQNCPEPPTPAPPTPEPTPAPPTPAPTCERKGFRCSSGSQCCSGTCLKNGKCK